MASTRFYVDILPETDVFRQAAKNLQSVAGSTASPERVECNGFKLAYDFSQESWFIGWGGVVTSIPPRVEQALGDGSVLRCTSVGIQERCSFIVGLAAYLGEYKSDPAFPGCTAAVTNDSAANDSVATLTISIIATAEHFGAYYAAIRSRQVLPAMWYQPRPTEETLLVEVPGGYATILIDQIAAVAPLSNSGTEGSWSVIHLKGSEVTIHCCENADDLSDRWIAVRGGQ